MNDYEDIDYPINCDSSYNVDNNNDGCLGCITIVVISLIVMFGLAMCNRCISHHPIDYDNQFECR